MSFFPNKLLLNILACGLVLSCRLHGATQAESTNESEQVDVKHEWEEFSSKEDGFKVDLPKKPERIQQTIDVPKTELKISYNTYLSEPSQNLVYVISVWNYPSEIDMSKPEVNLKDGFGGMLSALPGSEVLSMKMTEVQGYKALDFLVKNEDIFFRGVLILVENTLYQVFTVYKSDIEMEENYQHFINSFKLTNLDQKKAAAASNGQKVKV